MPLNIPLSPKLKTQSTATTTSIKSPKNQLPKQQS